MFHRHVETGAEGDGLLRRIRDAKRFGLDTESSGPALVGGKRGMINMLAATLTGISFAFEDEHSFYVPVRHCIGRNASPVFVSDLKREIQRAEGEVWVHNWKHELKSLGMARLPSKARCSLVLAWLLGYANEGRLGLKAMMKRLFNHDMVTFEEVTHGFPFEVLDPSADGAADYACDDAESHLRLGTWLDVRREFSDRERSVFLSQEMPFIEVACDVEVRGHAVNPDAFRTVERVVVADLDKIRAEWDRNWPFVKIGSTKDLRWFYQTGVWTKDNIDEKKTGLSTDKRAMQTQVLGLRPGSEGHRAASLRLRYSELEILRSTFTSSLIASAAQYPDGRLHPNINQVGTATGRISMSNPTLMNIPTRTDLGKRIRDAFVAGKGRKLCVWDYSQIELRILAHLAGGRLADAYREGVDLHQLTADLTGIDRAQAKNVNFAKIYGAGLRKLAYMTGMTEDAVGRALGRYDASYPEVEAKLKAFDRMVERHGYVTTIAGRRRYIPDIRSSKRALRGRALRQARNTPIQGSSGDITKQAMIAMYRAGIPLVNQVHDEIVAEVPCTDAISVLDIGSRLMKDVAKLRVPVEVSGHVVDRWSEAK